MCLYGCRLLSKCVWCPLCKSAPLLLWMLVDVCVLVSVSSFVRLASFTKVYLIRSKVCVSISVSVSVLFLLVRRSFFALLTISLSHDLSLYLSFCSIVCVWLSLCLRVCLPNCTYFKSPLLIAVSLFSLSLPSASAIVLCTLPICLRARMCVYLSLSGFCASRLKVWSAPPSLSLWFPLSLSQSPSVCLSISEAET